MKIINYSNQDYDLVSMIQELFDCENLQKLHEKIPVGKEYTELFKVGFDSSTIFHDAFYDKLNSGWGDLVSCYKALVKFTINAEGLNRREYIYQRLPTFRVHLPDNLAVGDFHRDMDFNHPPGEINFVIPLTPMYGTNTIWCEKSPGQGQHHPIPRIDVGDIFRFDGNRLNHGNLVNKTGYTRVSMDFRILSLSCYDLYSRSSSSAGSLTTNRKFTIGSYYEQFSK